MCSGTRVAAGSNTPPPAYQSTSSISSASSVGPTFRQSCQTFGNCVSHQTHCTLAVLYRERFSLVFAVSCHLFPFGRLSLRHTLQYIIGMDPKNIRDILKASNFWAERDTDLPQLDEVRGESRAFEGGCCWERGGGVNPEPSFCVGHRSACTLRQVVGLSNRPVSPASCCFTPPCGSPSRPAHRFVPRRA